MSGEQIISDNLQESPKKILYVIFHGELAFLDDRVPDHCIRVYAPTVPDHIFMAGPWLGEKHIPWGTSMELIGVESGKASIYNDVNFLKLNQNAEPRPVGAHFEIRLPRPEKILDGSIIQLKEGSITVGKSKTAIMAKTMDLRPIFRYVMKSSSAHLIDLANEATEWQVGAGSEHYYSLHIFAEEDRMLTDPDHAGDALSKAGNILGVNEVKATEKYAVAEELLMADTRNYEIPGLHPSEFQMRLTERLSTLVEMGRQLRNRADCLVWLKEPEVGTKRNHGSCGPLAG